MVDLTRPVMCSVDFKDYYKRPNSVHISVEVVLLDKTTSPLEPCLYQLNAPESHEHDYQAFTRLGTVVAIDTHKKVATLDNDNIITYQHLIIANGPQSTWMTPMPGKEFAAGVQVLMEALKMQEKKPATLEASKKGARIRSSQTAEVRKEALPKPTAPETKRSPSKDPKRVYQVQL